MKKAFYNGNIITMENTGADYIVIDNGIITDVGVGSVPSADEYVDLAGRTLLPAFIDSHSHMASVAYSFLQVQLDEITSIPDILDKIKSYINENNLKDGWVIANGYDHNILEEKRHITSAEIDRVSGQNAVVIEHKSGHSGVFNTEAQKRLGILHSENGYLYEGEYIEKLKNIPLEDGSKIFETFERAQKKYFSYGITTAQDGMAVEQLLPLYKGIISADKLKIDLVAYPDLNSIEKWFSSFPESDRKYNRNFKIGGLKIMLDGSPQGGTAWTRDGYIGGGNGVPHMTDDKVLEAVRWAKERNIQVLSHCNGDMACEQFINAVGCTGNERAVIIHAQLIRDDQLDRAEKYKMIPSFFIAHVYYWGNVHIKNFGLDRAKKISPAKSAFERNMIFTFHQDSPVVEPDMFKTVWCAVKRQTKDGIVLGQAERVDVMTALKTVTINAAYQYFEENEKGSLKKGKLADIIILDKNPLKVDLDEIKDIRVLETLKRGETVYKA